MAICVDIKKRIGEFSLDVQFASESKRIGILGASGCGKSMTLKSVAGIEEPDEGKIRIDERVLFDSRKRINIKPQKRQVGYLFQNYALFPTMTVEQNVAAGLAGNKDEKAEKVREMIKKFRIAGLEKRFPGELSGGQQQRVALARIMAYEPAVILLDEPYSALDMFLRDRLQQELLHMLEDYAGTIIMVSHNRDEIYRFSDDLLIMENGRAETFGNSREIFADPGNKAAARLTGCKNISKAELVDAHHLKAVDFGLVVHVEREIPRDTAYIGFRAHDFIPVWGERRDNCMKVKIASEAELPFEKQYYLEPDEEAAENEEKEPVCWFVQREMLKELEEKGMPDYVEFAQEKLLFLKS